MCGVAGIFHTDPTRVASTEHVTEMVRLLHHRGPDASGVAAFGQTALGHARLSILDLSDEGLQPMHSPSGAAIAYNGECYNFRELKTQQEGRGYTFRSSSDTEVVLSLYVDRGLDFVHELRGMFAMAIWDEHRKRLVLCRDRLGIKPLFYHFDGETLAFASELKALLSLPQVGFGYDDTWLGTYFSMLSVPGPNSIVPGVKRLLPGQMLIADEQGISTRTYWDINDIHGSDKDEPPAILRARLEESVAAHLVSDAPLGVALSGGIDSGLVCKLASLHADEQLNTYSATVPMDSQYDEAELARENGRNAGARLWETELSIPTGDDLQRIIWHMDEPLAVSSAIGIYYLAKRAHTDVKVLLTGDGADELFGGYLFRHGRPLSADLDPQLAFAHTLRYFGVNDLSRFLNRDFTHAIQEDWWRYSAGCLRPASAPPTLGDRLRAEMKTTLESEMLTKVDRMTMAWGVEARVPFLDHHFVEWAMSLPDSVRIHKNTAKWILRESAQGLLPRNVLDGRKKGFNVPFHRWLSDAAFRAYFTETVIEGTLAAKGVFSKQGILDYLSDYDAGQATLEQGHLAFAMLTFELWHTQFSDGPTSTTMTAGFNGD